MRIESYWLESDGRTPNHHSYPLVVGRAALTPIADGGSAEQMVRQFARNGWGGGWINGIYPFQHVHARSHEVLANLGDPVRVQFGGEAGPVLVFGSGDVALLPAGWGHCRLDAPASLVVVGAYPEGQEEWDLKRPGHDDYAAALIEIARVERPLRDPLTGEAGPMLAYWPV